MGRPGGGRRTIETRINIGVRLAGLYRWDGSLHKEVQAALQKAASLVYREAKKLASGPHYGPSVGFRGPGTGGIPVPVLTGFFRRSITHRRLSESKHVVFIDLSVAPYGWTVHEGDPKRNIKPRRILPMALATKQDEVLKLFHDAIGWASRDANRSVS